MSGMASWGNLEKACRVARQKFPGNNNVQRVFREGLRYLKVMYHHVPYSFLKLMIHYHNSFTDIQEIGVDQWLECIIECQAQWVTLSTSQGISSYDSDRRDRQLQVYRERATVPELKTIYEKETWETVNRHNGAIRLVKAWALLPAIQAYTDQFSDPDEMNEVDKGKLITAFRTLSHVVGEVMNKRSGAPDAKDLAPKIVFWELFKMLLPTCVSGDGNALDDLDHSAIKTANEDHDVDVSVHINPVLRKMWDGGDNLGEFLQCMLSFDMAESKMVEISLNFHKYNQKFIDEHERAKDEQERAAKEKADLANLAVVPGKGPKLTKAAKADLAKVKKEAQLAAREKAKEDRAQLLAAKKASIAASKADEDPKKMKLLGDEHRRDMWKELSDTRLTVGGANKNSFWNELLLLVNESMRGLDDMSDKVLAGAFTCRPLLLYAITKEGTTDFSQLYSSTLDTLAKIKETSASSGKCNLEGLSGKDIGALLMNKLCPNNDGDKPGTNMRPVYDQSAINTFSSFISTYNMTPCKRISGIKHTLDWIWEGGKTQLQKCNDISQLVVIITKQITSHWTHYSQWMNMARDAYVADNKKPTAYPVGLKEALETSRAIEGVKANTAPLMERFMKMRAAGTMLIIEDIIAENLCPQIAFKCDFEHDLFDLMPSFDALCPADPDGDVTANIRINTWTDAIKCETQGAGDQEVIQAMKTNIQSQIQSISKDIGLITPVAGTAAGVGGAGGNAASVSVPETPRGNEALVSVGGLQESTPSKKDTSEDKEQDSEVIAAQAAIRKAMVVKVEGLIAGVKKPVAKAKARAKDGEDAGDAAMKVEEKAAGATDGYLMPAHAVWHPPVREVTPFPIPFHRHDDLLMCLQSLMMSELFKITDAHTDWHKRFHYEISKKVSLYVDTTDVSNAVKTNVLKPEVVLPVVGHLTFDPTQGQSVGAFMGRNVYLFRNNQDSKYHYGNVVQDSTLSSSKAETPTCSESTIKISLNVVEEFPCIFGVYNHDDVALRLKELRRVIKAVKAHRVFKCF